VTLLEYKGADLQISLQLTGFKEQKAVTKHGFHVHQKGDIVSNGCNSAGGHFNPLEKTHGDITSEQRHVGDWGNIDVEADGTITHSFSDEVAKLSGPYR
jgi:Cu-Zn family superoxide dismutase